MLIGNFEQLLNHARQIKDRRVIVVFPNNSETFGAIADARKIDLARFILVGNKTAMEKLLGEHNIPGEGIDLIDEPVVAGAVRRSIALIVDGTGDILMKGGLDTSTLMKAVLKEEAGIRLDRLLSDVFIFEFPPRIENKFVMITDGGLTLAPDLKNKVELILNAVEVAHALGNELPRVAVLSASEFIQPNLPSTLDAAILSKMNDRGQIKGCLVDGPFALDNALSSDAAGEKKINSQVAGRADILLAPSIEAANSLAKSTTYFAGFRLAHVIMGGRVPILIPSRADKSDAKLLSIALGVLMSEHLQSAR